MGKVKEIGLHRTDASAQDKQCMLSHSAGDSGFPVRKQVIMSPASRLTTKVTHDADARNSDGWDTGSFSRLSLVIQPLHKF